MPDKDLKSLIYSNTPDEEMMSLLNFGKTLDLTSLDLTYGKISKILEDDQGNNSTVVLEAINGGKFNSDSSTVSLKFRRVPLELVFNSVKEVIYPDVPFLPGKDVVEEIQRIYGTSLFSEFIEADLIKKDNGFDKYIEVRALPDHPVCVDSELILIKVIYPNDPVSIVDIFKKTASQSFDGTEPFIFADVSEAESLARHLYYPEKTGAEIQPRLSLNSLFKGALE